MSGEGGGGGGREGVRGDPQPPPSVRDPRPLAPLLAG